MNDDTRRKYRWWTITIYSSMMIVSVVLALAFFPPSQPDPVCVQTVWQNNISIQMCTTIQIVHKPLTDINWYQAGFGIAELLMGAGYLLFGFPFSWPLRWI